MVYATQMGRKIITIVLAISAIAVTSYVYSDSQKIYKDAKASGYLLTEIEPQDPLYKLKKESIFFKKDRINILLIGTDTSISRRSNGQLGYNTDVMILVSVDTKTNKVLLVSVPRDLWVNGNKINALDILYGEDVLTDAFEKVTGQTVDGTIKIDFDGFKWLVDSFGGVPVQIQQSFTDPQFPTWNDSNIQTVSFLSGLETMGGERALTFCRSRKGNNNEGSDLMRAKRQHLVLQGMLEAIQQPSSIFWPMNVADFYETVTKHMETTLKLSDAYYLWDFYKDRNLYSIESMVVDDKYVFHPGMFPESPYTAWVFISKDENFQALHQDIESKLNGTYIEKVEQVASEPIENVSN